MSKGERAGVGKKEGIGVQVQATNEWCEKHVTRDGRPPGKKQVKKKGGFPRLNTIPADAGGRQENPVGIFAHFVFYKHRGKKGGAEGKGGNAQNKLTSAPVVVGGPPQKLKKRKITNDTEKKKHKKERRGEGNDREMPEK